MGNVKEKKWMRQYGIHIVVCAVVIGIAFGVNQKINLDRSHKYSLSGVIVLNEITDFKLENRKYIFKGWGFDPKNYSKNVKCELILQNTETRETVWPSMSANPEVQKIKNRYSDGGDYSAGSFEATVTENKIDIDNVYEILLRYTAEIPVMESAEIKNIGANSENEDSNKTQQYVVTVSTSKFLYNREIVDYDPKTFVIPEIAGTALEVELEGARLFHYFEEGIWVYVNNGKIYYILDGSMFPLERYPNGYIGVNWYTTNLERIPEYYQQYGTGNADFEFMSCYVEELSFKNYKVAVCEVPSEYTSIMSIGFYDRDSKKWVLKKTKQFIE